MFACVVSFCVLGGADVTVGVCMYVYIYIYSVCVCTSTPKSPFLSISNPSLQQKKYVACWYKVQQGCPVVENGWVLGGGGTICVTKICMYMYMFTFISTYILLFIYFIYIYIYMYWTLPIPNPVRISFFRRLYWRPLALHQMVTI